MAAETHPASSSSSNNYDYDYDVFLSFRGEDTRGTFTDHLHDAMDNVGIRTFRDKEKLDHGAEIGPTLLTAIEQSRILIPIFSKNYASSKWCLKELTKMMECKNKHGQIVWPIFYKVEPSHVRNQTGCFKEAFLKHEKEQTGCFFFFLAIIGCFKNVFLKHKREQGEEKVMTWRNSLKEAGTLKGWDSEDPDYKYETILIKSIVDKVLSELFRTNLHVAEHPIGIDSHVKEVKRMLDFESQGVQFVGIQGMGGLGKTTIAKAVFNNISYQFQSCSFLADVRERASQSQGLVNLQNKLASNLLKGKNLDINIANNGSINIKERFCKKKVLIVLDDVDHDDQLRALAGGCDWFGSGSRIIITTRDEHIIHVDQPDKIKIYKPNELDSNLSLLLFSKYAFKSDQPPQDLRKLSKEIVSILGGLPLAIVVVGSSLRGEKEHMVWEDTRKKLEVSPHIDVQKKLKISYDRLDLYNQKLFLDIACFFIGRDIESVYPAWKACGYFPGRGIKDLVDKSLVKIDNGNKLRMHDQLRDMGREIVQQENVNKPGERTRLWSHEEALDVLKKYEGTGKVEGLFLDFGYQEKNHHIDSCDSCIEVENYRIDSSSEEENYLTGFDYEEENYLSVCDHKAKNYLTDSSSKESTGSCYEENYLSYWDHEAENVKLPQIDPADLLTKAFEKMSDLRLLQVDHADHDENNFGQLPPGLKWLSLKGISPKCVPTISHLKKLAVLDLSGSKITDDWDGWLQIQLITTLKVLDLSNCNFLKRTPHFSRHTGLERLILDNCISLVECHESIGHLQKLVFLNLNRCNILELPGSICNLSSIKSLILTRSWFLERLPNLENLKSLQALCLSKCTTLFEIQGISGLSLLQQLDLEDCRKLKLLHELPPGLIKLNIRYCTSMERLPNLSTLKNLKELRLDKCSELAEIEGINGLTLLQELNLRDCKKLQSLPELPSSLIKLDATHCSSIERLPNLSNLKILQELLLDDCKKLSEIQGISGLSLLQQLDLNGCITLQSLPKLPLSLSRLDIRGCKSLERLPNLSMLKELKDIRLRGCYELVEIEGIDGLTLLEELDLTHCTKLQSPPELPSSLIKLDARSCGSIKTLPNLSNLKNLQVLHLCCSNLSEIQDISGLSLLQELELEDCKRLQSLPGLPSSLIRLDIEGYKSMERLPNLSSLRSLKVLGLNNCSKLANIQSINDLTLLLELVLNRCSSLQSLSVPTKLTSLNVYDCESLFEIQGISDLSLLQTLHLRSCRELQSIDLSNLRILESLRLKDCDNLAEIRGLESLESLIDLKVHRCHTYVKTLSKIVAEGMLPTATAAFKKRLIYKSYRIPDDDNIKGTIFYLVYPPSGWNLHEEVFTFEAEIERNDGKKTIRCSHDVRVEGMNENTDEDGFYSCYFQGLTWFGIPLKKTDIIGIISEFELYRDERKMYDLVMEYEAMEDRQQLEKRVIHLITSTSVEREGPRERGDDAGPSSSSKHFGVNDLQTESDFS